MELAPVTVPRMKTDEGAEGGLFFCAAQTLVGTAMNRGAGKILLLSDRQGCAVLAAAARSPRAVNLVLDGGDALPLFAMPDEICQIVAAGGAECMRAARFFAGVRRIPCALIPCASDLTGAFEEEADVPVGGTDLRYPLPAAQVGLDESLLAPTYAEGYARLLVCRLAFFERTALSMFDRTDPPPEALFTLLSGLKEADGREILRKNAALGRMGEGDGEGAYLARSCGYFAAFCALVSLYTAFFRYGSPRKYVVPHYSARAERAGVPLAMPPTEEDYVRRALTLEARRAQFLRELRFVSQDMRAYRTRYAALGGSMERADRRELLALPERAGGLTKIIRDFGLMEGA